MEIYVTGEVVPDLETLITVIGTTVVDGDCVIVPNVALLWPVETIVDEGFAGDIPVEVVFGTPVEVELVELGLEVEVGPPLVVP